jgi:outer membrane protein assembly factor BamD
MIRSFVRPAAYAVLALFAAGCASDPDRLPPKNPFKAGQEDQNQRELRLSADKLYRAARASLDSSDFGEAITRYDQLTQRYPFTEFATQAEMERVYAYYRNYQEEPALAAADRFLKEHPRHPHADYVQYLRGLVNSQRDETLLDFLPGVDPARGDVSYSRRGFDDFALLIQKYPQSRYVGDARARMVSLRNRIAQHEMAVVRFYLKRGAWLAAAKRAERVIADYPGAPATLDALTALETSYTELGLKDQAEDVRKLRDASAIPATAAPAEPTPPAPKV